MSLYGALFGGVSGLTAQSSKIGAISDNIANVNTIGYKQATATFSSLVVNSSSTVSYQTGGVRGGTVLNVSQQGLLQSTQSPTDLAISGSGFFVVRSVPDGSVGGTAATPLYTRAGSFTPDALGNFVNTNGFFLQGWPLDRDGRLPGDVGNLNTTSSSNFDSLKPVNIESASGVAQGTSTIALGANLKSSEVIYPGASAKLVPDIHNSNNLNLAADQIQVGSEFSLATADSLRRGDSFTVSASGNNYSYEYGGFSVGRDVTAINGAVNYGDSGVDNTSAISLAAGPSVVTGSGSTLIFNVPNHNMITGDTITLAGFGAIGATPAGEINGTHTIVWVDSSHFSISTTTAHVPVASGVNQGGPGETADIRQFKGNILDAVTSASPFFSLTSISGFTASSLSLQITTTTGGTQTFTYAANSPNTASGQFNSLNSLAAAINASSGLTARVVSGRLVVGAENANEAVTFTNGDAIGNAAGTQRGIDWVKELDVSNIAAGGTNSRRYSSLQGLANMVTADTGISSKISNPLASSTLEIRVDDPLNTIKFSDASIANSTITNVGNPISIPAGTLNGTPSTPAFLSVTINDVPPGSLLNGDSVYISGLANGIGGLPGLGLNGGPYAVTAVTGTTYTISVPVTQSVTLAGGTYPAAANNTISIAGKSNQGSVLSTFGFAGTPATATNTATPSLNGATYLGVTPVSTPNIGPQYDPSGAVGKNMASGDVVAQFSRNVRIYDSLGSGHDIRFSYIKTADNTWAVEVHAIPASEVKNTGTFVDGQIATGSVIFNGDGSLNHVTGDLLNAIPISWNNGAIDSSVTLNLGTAGSASGTIGATTIGLTDGLSQFDSAYNVNFANQNGAPVGQLTSVAIDKNGIVTASYSNGQTQALFKLPLASFANPDGLDALSGNVYSQTRASGEVNLREAGNNGTGSIVAAALEQSNVDLAEQLTDIIVAQRSYQANTKVIKTADDLLNELNQL